MLSRTWSHQGTKSSHERYPRLWKRGVFGRHARVATARRWPVGEKSSKRRKNAKLELAPPQAFTCRKEKKDRNQEWQSQASCGTPADRMKAKQKKEKKKGKFQNELRSEPWWDILESIQRPAKKT